MCPSLLFEQFYQLIFGILEFMLRRRIQGEQEYFVYENAGPSNEPQKLNWRVSRKLLTRFKLNIKKCI
jgi:hypothetical protein